jgi:hypothetical protein
LLELVDGQTAVARSRGPILRMSEATAHCAYTCTLRPTSSSKPRNTS